MPRQPGDAHRMLLLRQARAAHQARRALRVKFLDQACIVMVLPPHIRASVPMAKFALDPLADWMLRPGRNGDAELPDVTASLT